MMREHETKKQGGIWFLLALAVILGVGTGLFWYAEKIDLGISDDQRLIINEKTPEQETQDLKGASDEISTEDKELNQILTDLDSLEKDADPKNFDALVN